MKVTVQYSYNNGEGWKSLPQEEKTLEQILDLQNWIDLCWPDRYRLALDQKELKELKELEKKKELEEPEELETNQDAFDITDL